MDMEMPFYRVLVHYASNTFIESEAMQIFRLLVYTFFAASVLLTLEVNIFLIHPASFFYRPDFTPYRSMSAHAFDFTP